MYMGLCAWVVDFTRKKQRNDHRLQLEGGFLMDCFSPRSLCEHSVVRSPLTRSRAGVCLFYRACSVLFSSIRGHDSLLRLAAARIIAVPRSACDRLRRTCATNRVSTLVNRCVFRDHCCIFC